MNQQPKLFVLKLEVFPFDVLVAINKTPEQVKAWLSKRGIDVSEETMNCMRKKKMNTGLFLVNETTNNAVIYIVSKDQEQSICLFDHEKMHFLQYVMEVVGIPLTKDTDEVYAYSSAYLMKHFLRNY